MGHRFSGRIFGAGFASGDRFVAGSWDTSPFGAFADLMWARPDGSRALIAPTEEIAGFVSSHYTFDTFEVGDVDADGTSIRARGVELHVRNLTSGLLGALVSVNPLRRMHGLNDALASRVIGGVQTHGKTALGVRQRYVIHRLWRAEARGTLDGADLGPTIDDPAPARFGFSESPPFPFCVRVTTYIDG